jgi:bifunctional non-homologous end joining protein LigD
MAATMPLEEYWRKRRFGVTAEPRGKAPKKARKRALRFVVQKHRASRLHYDFRLEWEGVLLSWAVPKGPSLDPSVKRLAMMTEDHPLEYAKFEGIIPAGEYGGGTVMVWDEGTWVPDDPDVAAKLKRGDLKFTLKGTKLTGSWVLVRTRRRGEPDDGRQWLLIKHRDDAASTRDVAEEEPRSVKTNRILAEIAFDEGGDVQHAAEADPETAIRQVIANPKTKRRTRKKTPSVWRSNRSA